MKLSTQSGQVESVVVFVAKDDRTQQFRWTDRTHDGGLAWRQDSDLCLDAETFSNGGRVIAYECRRDLRDHQIWATL